MHLGNIPTWQGTAWLPFVVFKAQGIQFGFIGPLPAELGTQVSQYLGIRTLLDPRSAHIGQALAYINRSLRVSIRA
jgi:hypothetical protein